MAHQTSRAEYVGKAGGFRGGGIVSVAPRIQETPGLADSGGAQGSGVASLAYSVGIVNGAEISAAVSDCDGTPA